MTSAETGSQTDRTASGWKRGRQRLAAVMFGLLAVLAMEGVCRLAGWGDPDLQKDPFVGFSGTRPLFVLSDDGHEYVIPRVRREYFAKDSFPATKRPNERRIFCLGGSTVQGRPYSIATSFTTWLELALGVIDDEHDWDVVNCGGISYASYRLVPILEECLQHEPDLIILCTGHNEFLEDRTYKDVSRSPLLHRTSRLRLFNVARQAIDMFAEPSVAEATDDERTILPLETQPILNFNGGLEVYHRDDAWRRGVIGHFEANVRRMIEMAADADVPLLLMQPSSNVRDCPPFKSEHRAGLTPEELDRWESLIAEARLARESDDLQAARLFSQALEIDPEFPLTHYELGRAHLRLREYDDARRSFIRARDLDVCPLRMLSEMEDRLVQLAEQKQVPLIGIHDLLEAQMPDRILGDGPLVDHIHPSIEGHQRIADALVNHLSETGFVTRPGDWESSAHATYESHLATLDSAYFLRGQRMLEDLLLWSQGRADGPPAAERFPERAGRLGAMD